MAAGFTVCQDKMDDLRAFVNQRIAKQLDGAELLAEMKIDAHLSISALTLDFVKKINQLAPFGAANPEPRFCLNNVKIARPSVVGEHHIRCYLQDWSGGQSITGISFRSVDTPLEEILLKSRDKPV